jgi:tRNA threonylcarbamoyl adenosine modification protein (Sua5/YciO/YrdC/YwlC family)
MITNTLHWFVYTFLYGFTPDVFFYRPLLYMYLEIHPLNPQERLIDKAVEIIAEGGVVVFPTDTIYALGCDAFNNKAIEKVCRILGKKPEKANLSLICKDLGNLSAFTTPISTATFKLMKRLLPGPYTFILKANNNVPKIFKTNKKTVGIRVPDNVICQAIIEKLGHPMVSASIHSEDEIQEYLTDPEEIYEAFEKITDAVIDGGVVGNQASTVIDCTEEVPEVIREGKGFEVV